MTPRLIHALLAPALLVSAADAQVLYEIQGTAWNQQLGAHVVGLGDTNDDGHPDQLVAAFYEPIAYLISGVDGSVLHTVPFQQGEIVPGAFDAGDVNGDGRADFLMTADHDFGGRTWLVSGGDWSTLLSLPLLFVPTALGDVDRDGYDDFALRIENGVTVISGRDLAPLHSLTESDQHFGWRVYPLDDFNGDGHLEFAISTLGSLTTYGRVAVYSGLAGEELYAVQADHVNDGFGNSAALCPDLDGDAVRDFAVGVAAYPSLFGQPTQGKIVFYSGVDGSLISCAVGTADTRISSVHPAGDVDGDSVPDLFVIRDAPGAAPAFTEVWSGATLQPVASLQTLGPIIDAVGDVNHDGFDDIIVGNPLDFVNHQHAGTAQVLSLGFTGTPGRERIRGAGCVDGTRLPSIEFEGNANLGETLTVKLVAGRPNLAGILHLGNPAMLPLDFVDLADCTLYVDPFFTIGAGIDGTGQASIELAIPTDFAPVGFDLELQWLLWSPGANPLGVTMSDALATTLGVASP